MKRYLRSLSVSTVMLATVPGFAYAQSCQSATKVASDIFDKWGTELVAGGCVAVKTALASQNGTFSVGDALKCYDDAAVITEATDSLTGWWNTNIGKNAWGTLGPRRLTMSTNHDGKLVGTSGRMFITFPMQSDKATITISERDGKAKTSVVVCKHYPDGKWTQLSTRWFNDTNDLQRNENEKETIVLTGIKGYEISVHADAKSVANTFSYTVRADD
jgi:hypothetical protein